MISLRSPPTSQVPHRSDIFLFQSVFLLSLCLAGAAPEAEAGPAAYASDFNQYYAAEDTYEPLKENIYHMDGIFQFFVIKFP